MTGYPRPIDAPSPELLQRCVHCGFCLPTCPTYAVLGVEMDSPRGRIRLMETVWSGRVDVAGHTFQKHIDQCLDCRACETACPSGVEYGKLVEGARSQLELARKRGPLARLARTVGFRVILPRPAVLAGFVRFSAIARRLGAARVLRILGFGRLGDLLALVPTRVSSQRLPRSFAAIGARRGRVALFTGCVMRAAFSDTNAATARVLARNGGEALEALDVDAFIVNAAGCGAHLKEYGWLLKDDAKWRDRAERFASRVRDATEYLAAVGLVARPGAMRVRATYDDPCHLLHGQKIKDQPRELLRAIPGLELLPLVEADMCCGSAGTYNVTQPALSKALLERKVEHVVASGANMLVTANPGCQMQIDAGLRAARANVPVMHVMDVLDKAYETA